MGLKLGAVHLINTVTFSFFIPEYMEYSDISSIFKNKGSQQDLKNDRGIFILAVLRKILDKLINLDKYPDLDLSMSDSNIGARKNKNVRNHLFVVYDIVNSILNGGKGCVDIQIYDLVQAFDALWLEDCLNDLYDALPDNKRDDKLALVYQTNVKNLVAVNTAVGQTERVNMPNIVQQGGSCKSISLKHILARFHDGAIKQSLRYPVRLSLILETWSTTGTHWFLKP